MSISVMHGYAQRPVVLICSEAVMEREDRKAPAWASVILTVPAVGLDWFMSHIGEIEAEVQSLAQVGHARNNMYVNVSHAWFKVSLR